MTAPPPASGVRLPWSSIPPRVLHRIEAQIGAAVVTAVTQPGGFSPAVAARVTVAKGDRAFIKAVPPDINPDAPDIYRQESRIAGALSPSVPAPRLLWMLDEGDDGWVVLMFEDVDGHNPETPWRDDHLGRVMETLDRFWSETSPPAIQLPSAAEHLDGFRGWRTLTDEPPAGLDDWSRRHLQQLADIESQARAAASGTHLLHFDIRADNILLTEKEAYLVDWPHASIGDPAVDLVGFAPSVAMQGGPEPEELLRRSGITTDPDALTAIIAAIAGYFTQRALLPPPSGLPTLRAFQDAQGIVARRWLAHRTGWE